MKNEIKTLSHSTYRCEYHIVFAPKYRRKAIYGELRADIGAILRKLCDEKKVEIIEASTDPVVLFKAVLVQHFLYIQLQLLLSFQRRSSTTGV